MDTKAFSPRICGPTDTNDSMVHCMQIPDASQCPDHTSISRFASAYRDEVFVLYTMENLCKGPLGLVYSKSLPFSLFNPRPEQTTMNHCLLALAKIYFGLRTREIAVLQDGLCLYSRGLQMLNDVLDEVDRNITTETIVSVFALSLGEVCTLVFRYPTIRNYANE